jgi:hypothetical protein
MQPEVYGPWRMGWSPAIRGVPHPRLYPRAGSAVSPARSRARSVTAENIDAVSRPVKVFCWLGS